MGGDRFIERIRGMIEKKGESSEVARKERYAGRPELSELFKKGWKKDTVQRNRLMHKAHIRYGYTLSEIGKHLSLHYSTVSKAVKDAEGRMAIARDSNIKV